MNPQEVQRLRKDLGDKVALETLYDGDTAFRATVDKYRGVMTNMSPVAEAKFPTALLNKHYLKSFSPEKAVSPTTVQMANRAASIGRQNQETQQKSQGLLGFAGETISNIPGSAKNYAQGIFQAVTHPIQTAKTVGKLGIGAGINALETVTGNEEMFDNPMGSEDVATGMGQYIVDRYGSLEAAAETLKTDPVGFLSDVSTVVTGAAGAVKGAASLTQAGVRAATAGKTAVDLGSAAAKVGKTAGTVGKVAGTVAKAGINAEPIVIAGKTAKAAVKGAANTGKFGLAQLSGLSPDTINTIVNNSDFSAAQKGTLTRQSVADKVLKATQGKLDDLSDTGKAYEGVRKATGKVGLPADSFGGLLRKKGIKVEMVDDGLKVKLSTDIDTSIPITKAELAELEDFANLTAGKTEFTPAQFLNVRNKLTQMSKFDSAKSDAFRTFAKELRKEWNDMGRGQVKGLQQLDDTYSPLIDEVSALKKDFVEMGPNGEATLKDSALSKIANLTRKGSEKKLARVQELVPEIADEINAIKALEDVQISSGQKVGTYLRGGLGAVGIGTGNVPAIAVSILTSPTFVVPVLKFYGKLKRIPSQVIDSILSKVKSGERLTPEQAVIVGNALDHADEMDVPLNQLSPNDPGIADAARAQNILKEGGSFADAAKAHITSPTTPQ